MEESNKNWVYPEDVRYHLGGREGLDNYNKALKFRQGTYPYPKQPNSERYKALQENGYTVIKGGVSQSDLYKLKEEFEINITNNTIKGDRYYTTVKDPMVNCPTILDIATDNNIYDLVSEFFGCIPSIGTLNFRRSYINTGQPVTTQLFHCDPNSISFLKCFVYLDDVLEVGDGPLTIIPESLNKKPTSWSSKYRWTENEIKDIYGPNSLGYLTASAGDIIVTRATTAFHRGTPPINSDRTMLTLNYVIHPEEWRPPSFKISNAQADSLDSDKLPIIDFLVRS